MLKQRVITALLLLALLVPSVLASSILPFGVITLVLIACGAWEWARLNQVSQAPAVAVGGVCAVLCAASWSAGALHAPLPGLWITVGLAWVIFSAWVLAKGVSAWRQVPAAIRLVGGVLALWAAWLAVMQARVMGINFLFSVLVLVWVADIGAYFAGRALGNRFFARKLAPSISPGKTWEGAVGGLVGVLACAFLWTSQDASQGATVASLYTRLQALGSPVLLLSVLFLCAMSVVGDLVESLFKRAADVKDSSGLLPGHGGVLDRVDALLPVLPLAMMLSTLGTM